MNRCMASGTYFGSDNQDNLRFQVFVFHSYFVLLKSTVSLFLRSVPQDRPRCFIVFVSLFVVVLHALLVFNFTECSTDENDTPNLAAANCQSWTANSISRRIGNSCLPLTVIDSDLCWFGSGNQSCSENVIPGLEDMSLHVNSSYAFHIFAALPQLSNVLNGVV